MDTLEISYVLSNGETSFKTINVGTKVLDLSDCGMLQIDFNQFSMLESLHHLNLSDNLLQDIDIDALVKCRYLESIALRNNVLRALDLSFLDHLTDIRRIDASMNRISKVVMPSGHLTCKLQELNLSHNELVIASVGGFASFVVELDLSGNRLEQTNLDLQHNFSVLEVLDISDNYLTELDLSPFVSYDSLKRLNSSQNPLIKATMLSHHGLQQLRLISIKTLELDLELLSGCTALNLLELGRLSSGTDLIPLLNLRNLRSLHLNIETDAAVDMSPLFFSSRLSDLDLESKTNLSANWMLKYLSKKPSWFSDIGEDTVWDHQSRIEDVIPTIRCKELLESVLEKVEDGEIENAISAELCCEVVRVLKSSRGLVRLLDARDLKKRLERARRLKRQALVASMEDSNQSTMKKLRMVYYMLKEKLKRAILPKRHVLVASGQDYRQPTKKQLQMVSNYLKEHQNREEIRRMDWKVSSILTALLGISILIVLYYRISYPDLLNMLLANFAILYLVASVILPVLHSLSRYYDRIDYRITIGKITYLYIGNIIAIIISVLAFIPAERFLLTVRASFGSLFADVISLFLLFLLVLIWVRAAYSCIEFVDIKWLESAYCPSKRRTRFHLDEGECELNEVETFIAVGSVFAKLDYLVGIFAILNLAFVLSTISGLIMVELARYMQPSLLVWLVVGSLLLLAWKIIWTIVNGRATQVRLIERYLEQEKQTLVT